MSNDLGIDRSGNGNNWTVNNLAYSDQMVDSPTNNFATWNPLVKHTNVATTYAEGNLKATKAATYWTSTLANMYVDSGKWYAEFCCLTDGVYMIFGINAEGDLYANNHPGADASGYGYGYIFDTAAGRGDITYQDSTVSTGGAFNNLAVGTIIGITLDFDNNQVKFYANNVLQYTQTIGARAYTYSVAPHGGSVVANFGQDSSFAGNKTAQGNQDGNDIGDFYYTPPTGFLALCTSNLPDVAVVPSEHFNTVLYTGNGSTNAVTGVNFQPDFIWIKGRDTSVNHFLFDAVRGVTKFLKGDITSAEGTNSNGLTTFGSDGFTVGSEADSNTSSQNYVAWNWKAGTSVSGSSSGSGTTQSYTGSVNTDAGFSIIKYTGNGTDGMQVPHHLGVVPDAIFIKSLTIASWQVFLPNAITAEKSLQLDNTGAQGGPYYSTHLSDTMPTTSLVTLGNGAMTNTFADGVGQDYIMYCWANKDGYSKAGKYTGNASSTPADGTFVYTSFKPLWLMVRRTDATGQWRIYDTKRSPINYMDELLSADSADAEAEGSTSRVDFLSNGFKMRGSASGTNRDGGTYIYIAFAETPFKHSNSR
jgi:hypothetical protein